MTIVSDDSSSSWTRIRQNPWGPHFWCGARGQIDYVAFNLDPEAWSPRADMHIENHVRDPLRSVSMISQGEDYLRRRAASFDMAIRALHGISTYYMVHVCQHPVLMPGAPTELSLTSKAIRGPRCPLCDLNELLVQTPEGVLRYQPPQSKP